MFSASLLLLLSITYTLLMGLAFDPPAPYFPIEISRVLATGPHAYWSFIVTTLLLFPWVPHTWSAMTSWACVLGIGIVDDKTSWLVHMLFVAGIFVAATAAAMSSREHLFILCVAACLYMARLVFKAGAVALFELQSWSLAAIKDRSMHIMYGTAVCKSQATLLVFQLGGVLQWVVLWLVSRVLLAAAAKV